VAVSCITTQTLIYKMGKRNTKQRIQALTNLWFLRLVSSKRAQLRIQEMAFMLLGVFLFFSLVGIFAFTIVFTGVSDSARQIAEDRTLSSVTSLANTPEMSCVASKSNCIDGDKLINLVGRDIYGELWPYSSLRVIKFSGFTKDEDGLILCTKANYPNCDLFNIYDKEVSNERAISTHVALCHKELENGHTYDRCETAKIIAGTRLIQVDE
jgi:hypothetical protein